MKDTSAASTKRAGFNFIREDVKQSRIDKENGRPKGQGNLGRGDVALHGRETVGLKVAHTADGCTHGATLSDDFTFDAVLLGGRGEGDTGGG